MVSSNSEIANVEIGIVAKSLAARSLQPMHKKGWLVCVISYITLEIALSMN